MSSRYKFGQLGVRSVNGVGNAELTDWLALMIHPGVEDHNGSLTECTCCCRVFLLPDYMKRQVISRNIEKGERRVYVSVPEPQHYGKSARRQESSRLRGVGGTIAREISQLPFTRRPMSRVCTPTTAPSFAGKEVSNQGPHRILMSYLRGNIT
jgi:hypothetical protein